MSLVLRQFFKLIKLLNSERGAEQIAVGVCLGLILGLAPFFSLQTVLVLLCLLIFRVQLGSALLASFFFGLSGFLLDPVFHRIGAIILSNRLLEPVFTFLYNLPIFPLTRFNNSVVMGAAVASIVLVFPLYFLVIWLIENYRQKIVERFKETRAWSWLKATSFYGWYCRYDRFFG